MEWLNRFMIRKLSFCVDHWGIWIRRKGDEVCWLWWWNRKHNQMYRKGKLVGLGRWYSACCDGGFYSLRDIDEFWQEAYEASAKRRGL